MWNLKHLKYELINDVAACNTDHERLMVRTIGGKEIREEAVKLSSIRRLTPGELAIAQEFGY